ncbi:Aerobic glycerol-3-phosphate dehydrogenase [hydrothermal vent metagenome]|uniref:Aerobic glycerol-3-phosphate dehydrogenase n=1 Tax=hydrothermal vent metagenome TaxID=652676 RepID=A0A3B1D4J3_9ZZZZ
MKIPHYDVLVIGGGIHGAGVAQAAAARGHRVLVLEQHGIGSGTSSRSSKLIHGGLRYLETAQLSLVYESLHERTLLLKNAPDLVKLTPFYIPVYKNATRSPSIIRCGLSLYALLGGLKRSFRFRKLLKSDWDNLDGLQTEHLSTVYQYWDAQTDDQALTQAVLNTALALGAKLHMPAIFQKAIKEKDHYKISYLCEKGDENCTAATLVNATGPWVDSVLDRITPSPPKVQVELVQGTHILLKETVTQGIYYLEAPSDKRPVFVMPWKGQLMVGTTETIFKGNPSEITALDDEKDYLLETLSAYFPQFKTRTKQDIQSAFAGCRVLPKGYGHFASRPRETVLQTDVLLQPRLLTIYGGKLTTYRITAEKVMNQLVQSLPAKKQILDTAEIKLTSAQKMDLGAVGSRFMPRRPL